MCNKIPCPTEAAACFKAISSGLDVKPNEGRPAAVAPEETNIISFPALAKLQIWRTNISILSILMRPFAWVSELVPTLTITRFACRNSSLIASPHVAWLSW